MKKIFYFFFAASIFGCTVHKLEVANNPPPYDNFIYNDGELLGALKFESASFFLWPEGLNKDQLTGVMKTALINSKKIDELSKVVSDFNKQKEKLESYFFGKEKFPIFENDPAQEPFNCIERWSANPDEDFDEVSKWKPADPAPADLIACQENQRDRKTVKEEIDKTVGVINGLIDEIYKKVDSGYPLNPINIISVNSLESSGMFAPENQIELFFKEFDGHNQKAYDIIYSNRVLQFKLKKLDANGKETGFYYSFKLQRAPNFIGRIRLMGDMNLNNEKGEVVRKGSGKIDGFLLQE